MSFDPSSIRASNDLVAIVGTATKLVKSGSEYRGCCPVHGGDNPSAFVVYTDSKDVQRWSCYTHGCHENEEGSDVIGFVMALRGIGFKEACEYLGGKHDLKPVIAMPPKPKQALRVTSKPPAGNTLEKFTIRALGEPVKVWTYLDTDGGLLGYVARYETPTGKEIRCFTWGAKPGEPERWGVGAWTKPRPLYGLQRLAEQPDATVVIVEGEKAADAAAQILEGYVPITWPGGAMAWKHAEWSPLRGRKILLWPDNDEAGRAAMAAVGHLLSDPKGLACK